MINCLTKIVQKYPLRALQNTPGAIRGKVPTSWDEIQKSGIPDALANLPTGERFLR